MGWREQSEPVGASEDENESLFQALKSRGKNAGKYLKSEVMGLPNQLPRQLGLAARSAVTGVTAIPGMAADAAMAGYNLLTGSNQQMPTQATQNLMTQVGLPEPQGTVENVNQFLGSTIAGAKIPMPSINKPAPENFQPELTRQQRTFDVGRKEGYVVPPATIEPTFRNVALESIGGKQATEQVARARNQQVTNRLANRALGLPEEREITQDALEQVRENAGQVYDEISRAGQIIADVDYRAALLEMQNGIKTILADFPKANVAAADEIQKLIQSLDVEKFDARSALEYLKSLRNTSSKRLANAGDPNANALGRAEKQAAEILEEMIFRNLRNAGKGDLAQKFDAARRQIAKSYTIQSSLDEASGSVDARKLAQQLNKGKPLSPELETAARMGGAFPRAMTRPEVTGSAGSNALDAGVTAVGAAVLPQTQIPWWVALGYAPVKYGARRLALSDMLQRQMLGEPFALQPQVIGGAAGAEAERRREKK